MTRYIELHRMITGVESKTMIVDDEVYDRIKSKTITRDELNELMEISEGTWDVDIHANEYPHSVYVPKQGDHPEVYTFEDK